MNEDTNRTIDRCALLREQHRQIVGKETRTKVKKNSLNKNKEPYLRAKYKIIFINKNTLENKRIYFRTKQTKKQNARIEMEAERSNEREQTKQEKKNAGMIVQTSEIPVAKRWRECVGRQPHARTIAMVCEVSHIHAHESR